MVTDLEFIETLVNNNYIFFISSNKDYREPVGKVGGTFISVLNDRYACEIALGMRLSGLKVVVFIENSFFDFIKLSTHFCLEYGIALVAVVPFVVKVKEISCLYIVDGYENKLKKKLLEADNNNSLLLIKEGLNEKERCAEEVY